MSKEQVMDYVMTTPSNPNRAVLSGMLDEISGTQLPPPTESDNGKVLGVDGGEYKLVEQSGGGTVERLTFSEGFYGNPNGVKNGRVVTLDIVFGKQGSISGNEKIVDLPSGYTPLASTEKFIAYPVGDSASNPITLQVVWNYGSSYVATTSDVSTTQMNTPYVAVVSYLTRE